MLDGETRIASHRRTFDKGQQIEDPAHVAGLVAAKRAARAHRGVDRLAQAVPATGELLRLAAERGTPLSRATAQLVQLLDTSRIRRLPSRPRRTTKSTDSSPRHSLGARLRVSCDFSRKATSLRFANRNNA